jgi:hypothetical protein
VNVFVRDWMTKARSMSVSHMVASLRTAIPSSAVRDAGFESKYLSGVSQMRCEDY